MKEEQAEERGTKHEVNPYELDDVNEGNHFKMKRAPKPQNPSCLGQ